MTGGVGWVEVRFTEEEELSTRSEACGPIMVREDEIAKMYEQTILEKLRRLSPKRLSEGEDFIDLLFYRQE